MIRFGLNLFDRNAIWAYLIYITLVVCAAALWSRPFALLGVFIAASALALRIWWTRRDLRIYTTGALLGTLGELVGVMSGGWIYSKPLVVVPIWLPPAWGLALLAAYRIAEPTGAMKTRRPALRVRSSHISRNAHTISEKCLPRPPSGRRGILPATTECLHCTQTTGARSEPSSSRRKRCALRVRNLYPRNHILLAVACIVSLLLYTCRTSEDRRLFGEATSCEENVDLNGALAAYQEIIDNYPKSPHLNEARDRSAQLYFMAGLSRNIDDDFDGAYLMYKKVRSSSPVWERIGDVDFFLFLLEARKELLADLEKLSQHYESIDPPPEDPSPDELAEYLEDAEEFVEGIKRLHNKSATLRGSASWRSPQDSELLSAKATILGDIDFLDEKLSLMLSGLDKALDAGNEVIEIEKSGGSTVRAWLQVGKVFWFGYKSMSALEEIEPRVHTIIGRQIARKYYAHNRSQLDSWGYHVFYE